MILGMVLLLAELILVFVLSLLIAFVGLIIVYCIKISGKRRLYLFAFHTPFIACYTFYFCLLGASSYISQKYNVDSGLEELCYVPLIGESRLEIINLPETASIMKGDTTIIHGVVKLYQKDSVILGKIFDHSCFTFNGDTLIYERESILATEWNQGQPIAWQTSDAFYRDRREAITGNANDLALLVCLMVAFMVVWILKRIVLGKTRRDP